MIIIKKATANESQILSELFSVLYSNEIKSKDKIKNNIMKNKKQYFIAFSNKKAVGAISLKFDGKQCELEAIAVKDRIKGYGKKLIQFAENIAKERKCTKIWCFSLIQHGVEDFYKKLGWIEEDLIKDLHPGEDCYKFSKSFNRA